MDDGQYNWHVVDYRVYCGKEWFKSITEAMKAHELLAVTHEPINDEWYGSKFPKEV